MKWIILCLIMSSVVVADDQLIPLAGQEDQVIGVRPAVEVQVVPEPLTVVDTQVEEKLTQEVGPVVDEIQPDPKVVPPLDLSAADIEIIASELSKESQNPKHTPETKKFIKGVADGLKTPKQLTKREKAKEFMKKMGRGIGRGSAWLTTATLKPFIATGAFVKGFSENPAHGKNTVAIYKFFLKYSSRFEYLYQDAGTPEELTELALAEIQDILEKKSLIIAKDVLKAVGLNKSFKSLADISITEEELGLIDFSKLKTSLVNNHPEFQDVRPLVGDLMETQVKDIIESGYFDQVIDYEKFKEAIPNIPEGVSAVLGQVLVAPLTLSIISGALATIYAVPVLAADIGTGASVAFCLKEKNRAKFADNQELRSFCSYVTNRSVYQIAQTRVKSYVAGKKIRQNIKARRDARKARRAARKSK